MSTLTVRAPFRDALIAITGADPPWSMIGVYCFDDIETEYQDDLSDWASANSRPRWATGLSMIESAELIVLQAVENCNITAQAAAHEGVTW